MTIATFLTPLQLGDRVLNLSLLPTAKGAAPEWKFKEIEIINPEDSGIQCLCGRHPAEYCIFFNAKTKNEIVLEPECIQKTFFVNIANSSFPNALKILEAYRKILNNPEDFANTELVHYAFQNGIFSSKDKEGYEELITTLQLSEGQKNLKSQLNHKFIYQSLSAQAAFQRLVEDVSSQDSIGFNLLKLVYEKKIINDEEYFFYQKNWNNSLSSDDLNKKIAINVKIYTGCKKDPQLLNQSKTIPPQAK